MLEIQNGINKLPRHTSLFPNHGYAPAITGLYPCVLRIRFRTEIVSHYSLCKKCVHVVTYINVVESHL